MIHQIPNTSFSSDPGQTLSGLLEESFVPQENKTTPITRKLSEFFIVVKVQLIKNQYLKSILSY